MISYTATNDCHLCYQIGFTAPTSADTLADTQRDERGTDVLKREEISEK